MQGDPWRPVVVVVQLLVVILLETKTRTIMEKRIPTNKLPCYLRLGLAPTNVMVLTDNLRHHLLLAVDSIKLLLIIINNTINSRRAVEAEFHWGSTWTTPWRIRNVGTIELRR